MFGKKANSNLTFIVIALGALLIGFNFLGPLGGVLILAALIGWMFYSRRASMFYNAARKCFDEGDMEGARNQLRKSVQAEPQNSIILSSCGFMLLKMGNPVEAERLLTRAVSAGKTPQEKYSAQSMMSLLLWKKGQLEEAISLLSSVMEDYKTSATYASMGFYQIERGNAEEALSFNREAYAYNDKNPVILDNYGSALLMAGEHAEALRIYDELIKLNPKFPEAWFNYGRLLEATGQDQEALRMYQEASTKKFWYTSTITREEVEESLSAMEEKLGITSESVMENSMEVRPEEVAPSEETTDDEAIAKTDIVVGPDSEEKKENTGKDGVAD